MPDNNFGSHQGQTNELEKKDRRDRWRAANLSNQICGRLSSAGRTNKRKKQQQPETTGENQLESEGESQSI